MLERIAGHAALLIALCTVTQCASAAEVGSYYTAWSAESTFRLKQLDQAGLADKFTYLNYAFENVYKMPDGTYRCDTGRDIDDHEDGLGMRASLDYTNPFSANQSVDGSADQTGQALAGNFNQIKQLKAKHSQLKVLVSLGGGEWSRWFSAGAATPTLRRVLVASCIDLYLKGNLPAFKGYGGKGTAAGLFDGIDLDWEHPGVHGAPYNTVSQHDKQNFTLLLAEFRKQLTDLGKHTGKHYLLTAAVNSTSQNMQFTEPAKYSRYLDWINLMTYDFYGSWNPNGPTDFQSNLYPDPASPNGGAHSVEGGVKQFLNAGVAPEKIVIGVPFYARGWKGVAPTNNGLYQKADAPADGFEAGVLRYSSIATMSVSKNYHPVTKQVWIYENGTFWSFDDPVVIREKINYIRSNKLGGIMSWSLDQDDAGFALSNAMAELR